MEEQTRSPGYPASLNEHLHVSRVRILTGGWEEECFAQQDSENLGPGEEECFAPARNKTQQASRTPLSQGGA